MKIKTFLLSIFGLMIYAATSAQDNSHYIRIAKIVVDSANLEDYKHAVKEQAEAAVSKEPGVITLYAVQDKDKPTNITVFEIYASIEAYKLHIQTDHFKKYKTTVEHMVKSLTLTDVDPIVMQAKH